MTITRWKIDAEGGGQLRGLLVNPFPYLTLSLGYSSVSPAKFWVPGRVPGGGAVVLQLQSLQRCARAQKSPWSQVTTGNGKCGSLAATLGQGHT